MNNQKDIEKKPIAPILINMEVGESEMFDIERLSSVRVTKDRVQKEKRRKFRISTTSDNITITRVA